MGNYSNSAKKVDFLLGILLKKLSEFTSIYNKTLYSEYQKMLF